MGISTFAIVGASGAASTSQSPQLRGSQAKPEEVKVRVVSKAAFPITLANCEGYHTVPPYQEYVSTLSVPKSNFYWVVPEGATWLGPVCYRCIPGCPKLCR